MTETKLKWKFKNSFKQECIPIGCVPTAAVAISGVGAVSPSSDQTTIPRPIHPPPPFRPDQTTPYPRGQTGSFKNITFPTSLRFALGKNGNDLSREIPYNQSFCNVLTVKSKFYCIRRFNCIVVDTAELEQQVNTLHKVLHVVQFNTAIHALMLLYQVMDSR